MGGPVRRDPIQALFHLMGNPIPQYRRQKPDRQGRQTAIKNDVSGAEKLARWVPPARLCLNHLLKTELIMQKLP
jgi:hypothetical protein